ncbi:MAG TPA: crossover junction endodeoxyribonuclease RuvC [Polyangiales bacterium]|jgi:crossover junction endodeoxyribonuclease RuvC|nr:crossover junction endodeoxyribonuclease RuvC [Polyangiales bacterium]
MIVVSDIPAKQPSAFCVLGVDPGSVRTGWGVIRRAGPKLTYVAAGTIETDRDDDLPARLREIYEALSAVITEHAPTAMAVEDIFHAKFAGSALKLGHARGVALLVGANAGLAIAAYAPALVKRSVAGRGAADKQQVARIVGAILGLRELPKLDATDALAIAITHAQALMSIPKR